MKLLHNVTETDLELRGSRRRRRRPRAVHHQRGCHRVASAVQQSSQRRRIAEVDGPPLRQLLQHAVGAVVAALPPRLAGANSEQTTAGTMPATWLTPQCTEVRRSTEALGEEAGEHAHR